ncbi:MAG: hypothetical protein AB8H86_04915 [Polyangiales bacterium]
MKHRFLHTLVFSSVLALEGCASTPPEALDVDTASSGSGAEVVEASTSSESYGGSAYGGSSEGSSSASGSGYAGTVSRAPEPAVAEAEVTEMRQCEVGWGTTKSGRRRVDPWDCSVVRADGVERTECTDASGRCLQP